jgi:hypothetical protein
MTSGMVTPFRPPLTLGKRLYRALFFAVMVGLVGAGMSVIPALFVQSIFVGNAQYCEQVREEELRVYGEIRTDCATDLSDEPTWLPPAIVASGGLMGILGGAGYGFVSPQPGGRRNERERPWLPF